jgi:hypothetical protein
MIPTLVLFRSRRTARAAKPEPHERLTATVVSAEAFAAHAPYITPIDVEVTAYVADIADDTLEFLQLKREVGPTDLAAARRVLAAARRVRDGAPTDAEHLDTLINKIDSLYERTNKIMTEEYRA